MRILRILIVAMIVLGLLFVPFPTLAQELEERIEDVPEVEVTAPPVGLVTLTGMHGGAFDHYELSWDTSGEATLLMTYTPAGSLVDNSVGFNVWGPDGLVADGTYQGTQGVKEATFDADAGTVYQLQVFNYMLDLGLAYSFDITPEIRDEVLPPTPDEIDEEAIVGEPVTDLPTGTMFLMGQRVGAFHSFDVSWDTDATVNLVIEYAPSGEFIDRGFGFNVWGPDGRLVRSSFTGTQGAQEATFEVEAETIYQIQVFNYLDEFIGYRLITSLD